MVQSAAWRRSVRPVWRSALKGDVVFGGRSAAGRGRGEVAFVGRDVAARRAEAAAVAATASVAVATAGPVARAKELDAVGDDLDRLPFAAVFRFPLAPVEAAFDRHGAPLGEVVGAVLALRPPDGHVEVVGLVDPVAALVFAAAVDRDPQVTDGGPAAGMTQLRIPGQVPGDDHHVHVRSCQFTPSLRIRFAWTP